MALAFHKDLLAGRYRAVADSLLDSKKSSVLSQGHAASLIGALSFMGRIVEADALFSRPEREQASSQAITAARFFLGIGWARKSEYAKARSAFALNEETAGKTALERFFVHQGKVFYAYYAGRFRVASVYAARARRSALRSGNLFARALATDADGHCRVAAGEIHHGLRLLEEARELAIRLENTSLANTIAVSLELYDAEYALTGKDGLVKLEARWNMVGTEDNYSFANVGLELSRQYTRRGRFQEATKVLESVASPIYANQNRRQEILLNLRMAELACRRGDAFGARHYLRFLRRLLHGEVDSSFELAAVGLERKLAQSEGKKEEVSLLTSRWKKLARDFGNTRDDHLRIRMGFLRPERENQEDRVHHVLQSSRTAASLPDKLRPLLEQDFLCDAADCLGLAPGRDALVILPQSLGIFVYSPAKITWIPASLSTLQTKILRVLSAGDADKERIVESAWGYSYDSIRHDAMVYAAISSLRKSIGPAADWVQVTESGYRFTGSVIWAREAPALKTGGIEQHAVSKTLALKPPLLPFFIQDPHLLSLLNHRQIEILEWLQSIRFISVKECRNRFDVSGITALRDLDSLLRHGLVLRNGRARATRYMLPDSGASP